MGCSCGNSSDIQLKHLKPLCNGCFNSLLLKRVQKEIRGFKGKTKVLLVDRSDAASHLLKSAFSLLSDRIVLDIQPPGHPQEGYDHIVVSDIADDLVVSFLDEVLNDKSCELPVHFLQPLKGITKEELIEYAKLHNLEVKLKSSKTQEFVDGLEEQYPNTKFAILKSREILR